MNKTNKNLLYAGVVIAAIAYFFRDKSEVSTTDSATNNSPAVETSGSGGSASSPTSGGSASGGSTSGGGTGTPSSSGGNPAVESGGSGTGFNV